MKNPLLSADDTEHVDVKEDIVLPMRKRADSQLPPLAPVTLCFDKITYSLPKRDILSGVSGYAKPGQLLAILGPSGCGKSTLLDIISFRKMQFRHLVQGSVVVNGTRVNARAAGIVSFYRSLAFVSQEELLFPTLTVRETLEFSANLRLPPSISATQKAAMVDSVLNELGLSEVADTRIGGILPGGLSLRGISGGQKRRVSIGCALVTHPSILVLDEPTSGLDSAAALSVMQTLKNLATAGRTVLARGRTLYFGSAHTAVPFFEKLSNTTADPFTNAADFCLDFVADLSGEQVNNISNNPVVTQLLEHAEQEAAEAQKASSVAALPSDISSVNSERSDSSDAHKTVARRPKYWTRLKVLFQRAMRVQLRNPGDFGMRVGMSSMLGVFFGLVFFHLGTDELGIEPRLKALWFIALITMLNPFMCISLFQNNRQFFLRERTDDLYGCSEYLISQLVGEIMVAWVVAVAFVSIVYWQLSLNPADARFAVAIAVFGVSTMAQNTFVIMISTLLPTQDAAFGIGAFFVLLQNLFGGFFVRIAELPRWGHWLPQFAMGKYTFQASVVNEFAGRIYDCVPSPDCRFQSGQDVIAYLVDQDLPKGECIGFLLAFFCSNCLLCYLILRFYPRK